MTGKSNMGRGRRGLRYGLILSVILLGGPLHAGVRLANIFSSNGVIQHGKPAPVWGLSDSGEVVRVTLEGIEGCRLNQSHEAVADRHGKWMVTLDPLTAGDKFHLHVQGHESRHDSYRMQAGDIWFYAGNYRFRYRRLIPQITDSAWREENKDLFPLLRIYGTADKNTIPQRVENGVWREPSADNIFGFNPGVATHFGMELCRAGNVPVGIVHVASIYGHWIDEYLPAEGVVRDPVLGQTADARKLVYRVGWTEEGKQLNAARVAYMEEYLNQSIRRNADNRTVLHPDYPQAPAGAETKTSLLFNGAIHPMLPLAVKGVIFSDPTGQEPFDAHTHGAKLGLLIASLREWFGDPALPVILMQEAALPHQHTIRANTRFAVQQQLAQRDPHVAIAVTHDIAVFDEPADLFLKTIPATGHRAYLMADRLVYGHGSSTNETPRITGFTSDKGKMTINFSMPLRTFDGLEPDGFALRAKGQSAYRTATARLEGNTIELTALGVETPEHANYGYVNAAIRKTPNIVGENKMPLPAFSTELLPQAGKVEP
jgi:sialate O-acetylesterase